MNGIKFADYKNSPQTWSLVTIRFRKDTGEMRLTYANPLAMKTLRQGQTNYPDGSAFSKVGIITGEDVQFPSSVVPRAVRRYQLMVKNRKTYASTDGWGYGLFDADGKTYPEDPLETQQACHACHQIVENRGYVFSQPFDMTEQAKLRFNDPKRSPFFVNSSVEKFPPELMQLLPDPKKQVRFLENTALRKNVFQGTLDELKPLLEKESLVSKMPAVYLSLDGKRFSVAVPRKNPACLNELGADLSTTTLNGEVVTSKVCLHD